MLLKRCFQSFTIALALCMSVPAYAANWDWGSRFGINGNWNDNPALADEARNPQSTFRILGAYDGEFKRLTPGSEFRIEPRITRDYYPDEQFKDLESTNLFLPGGYTQSQQRSVWNLGWNLSRQNVLSDETTISQDDQTNRLSADDTVYRFSLTPSVSWYMSERDQIFFAIGGSITDYDLDFTNRADSQGATASLTYTRELTQRHSLGFSAIGSTFDSERLNLCGRIVIDPGTGLPVVASFECNITNTSDNTSLTADYGYNFTDTSRLKFKLGLQKTTTETELSDAATGQSFSTSVLPFESNTYDIIYEKFFEKSRYSIIATRRVIPASNGQPQDRYELGFDGQSRLTEKLLFRWDMRAWDQQNVVLSETEGDFNFKTRFFSSNLRLSWSLTRDWSITGQYGFRYRSRDASINSDDREKAISNQIIVGLTYYWRRIQD